MATTLVDVLVHVVFSTKNRANLISQERELKLFPYITGVVRRLNSRVLALNGVEDHMHILVSLAKTIAVSELVREVKKSSSRWINTTGLYKDPFAWQRGFGAFSVSQSNLCEVRRYIASQKEHHKRMSFQEEYLALLRKHRIDFDERYIWD